MINIIGLAVIVLIMAIVSILHGDGWSIIILALFVAAGLEASGGRK